MNIKKTIEEYKKNIIKHTKKHQMKYAVALVCYGVGTVAWFLGGREYWTDIMNSQAGSAAVIKKLDENGNEIGVIVPRDTSKMKTPDVCRELIPWGTHEYNDKAVKDRSLWLCKGSFSMQYDPAAKYPLWVAEIINKKNLVPFNIPKSLTLSEDETLPPEMQTKVETYHMLPEGYKPGLIAPILNRYLNMDSLTGDKLNEVNYNSLKDAFAVTNAYPVANNAKVIIDKIDQNIREFAEEKNEVFVISGLIYLNGKSLAVVKNGTDQILIPTHIYKIVTYPNTHASISYIIPNINNLPCGKNCSLEQFEVPMQEVERVTGIEFYTKLAPYYAVQVKKDLNQIFKDAIKPKE